MRVVHACTYDRGGAANAALRLHRGLLAAGVDSTVVVGRKTIDDPAVLAVPGLLYRGNPTLAARLEYRLGRCFCPFGPKPWGPAILPGSALKFIDSLRPDIVHLHWVSHGFLSIGQIGRIRAPLVWTLHDMWALTPGYGYRVEPGPALKSIGAFEELMPGPPFVRLARNVWQRKLRAWRQLGAAIVAPSHWLAEEARRSEVLRGCQVRTIPYSVPLDVFRPRDRVEARRSLGLPEDRPLILFGADGAGGFRKGGDLLAAALVRVREQFAHLGAPPLLVVFGPVEAEWADATGCEARALGAIEAPERLATVYAACDVFACPSREDNLPNTVLESLACGTPVVGFRVGGLPDLVEDDRNGFLAAPFDIDELGAALLRAWREEACDGRLGRAARAMAEERWNEPAVTARYLELYRTQAGSGGAEV